LKLATSETPGHFLPINSSTFDGVVKGEDASHDETRKANINPATRKQDQGFPGGHGFLETVTGRDPTAKELEELEEAGATFDTHKEKDDK
jgi:hypothetical protein